MKEMRKHMAWYLKGMTGSARIKDVLMEMTERDEMANVLNDYVAHLRVGASANSNPKMKLFIIKSHVKLDISAD